MISKFKPQRIRSLGTHRNWAAIFFAESSLELATAKTVGGQVNVDRQTSANVAATEEGANPKAALESAVQSLRQQIDPREHRIVTAVSCEDVFCQSLRLPTTQADELKQMLDLQIDTLTPLPLEDVVYSFEPLEKTDTDTKVLVAVARKAAVNERVGALEAAGLEAEVVAVDTLAAFHGLVRRDVLPRDEKLNVFVLFTVSAANVVVYSHGSPVTVRSIVAGEGILSSAENKAALREELTRTLVAAEAEMPKCETGRMTFATWSERLRAEVEELARTWSDRAEFLSNGSAPSPALSLCVETATEEAVRLNLLPDEWRQRRRTARFRKTLIRAAIAVGAVYLLAVAVFLTMMGIRRAQLSRVESEIKKHGGEFTDARQLHRLLFEMQKQIDPKYSALEVLRQVSALMPADNSLKLASFDFKKDATVKLRGQTASAGTATEFISRLEKCELFSKVNTGSMRTDGGLTKFDVVCSLKSGAGAAPAGGLFGAK
jgi:Tfp pilus assembly PilM family ATPase